jgi:hypothetical protein
MIEKNETNFNNDYLIFWSQSEEFPSFGIAHFIWLPEAISKTSKFIEKFPEFIKFVQNKTNTPPLPSWIQQLWDSKKFYAPWLDRKEFYTNLNKPKLNQLRTWLKKTKSLQAQFVYQNFIKDINNKFATNILPKNLKSKFKTFTSNTQGKLIAIDYANFKGLGFNKQEMYQGKGWGLFNVLRHSKQPVNVKNFITSAKYMLARRIKLSPKGSNEQRWMEGWFKRINKYNL